MDEERRNLLDGVKDEAVAQDDARPAQWTQPTGVEGDEGPPAHGLRDDVQEEQCEVEPGTDVGHPAEIQQEESSVVHLDHLHKPGRNEHEALDGVKDPEVLGEPREDEHGDDQVEHPHRK